MNPAPSSHPPASAQLPCPTDDTPPPLSPNPGPLGVYGMAVRSTADILNSEYFQKAETYAKHSFG